MDFCDKPGLDYLFGVTGTKALAAKLEHIADPIRVERVESGAAAVRGFRRDPPCRKVLGATHPYPHRLRRRLPGRRALPSHRHDPAAGAGLTGGAEPQDRQPFVPTHSEIKTPAHTAMEKAQREPALPAQPASIGDNPASV